MNPGEAAMLLAVGFVPTLIALQMVSERAEQLGSVEKFRHYHSIIS
jgi:hypothetical protein